MAATPKISVVIPVYNGAAYIGDAIRSALSQTYKPFECLVVDDGSTDATAEVVRAFGDDVKYIFQENSGVSVARNRGVAAATSELVGFLDHDDAWLPTKLERQLEALLRHDATLALCAMIIIDADGNEVGEARQRPRVELLTGMLTFDGTETVPCSSTGLIWKDALQQLGGFDPRLGMSADWDLTFNVLVKGTLAYVDEPLVRYRVHATNMSRDIGLLEHDMRYAFGKAFSDPMLPAGLRKQKRQAYAGLYKMLAGSYGAAGRWGAAVRLGTASVVSDPRPMARAVAMRGQSLVRQALRIDQEEP